MTLTSSFISKSYIFQLFIFLILQTVSYGNRGPIMTLSLPYSKEKGVVILTEETPLNSIIGILEAKMRPNKVGSVDCSTNNEYVGVTRAGGHMYKVVLNNYLDREVVATVRVAITCTDTGIPPKTSRESFTIKVRDVNDVAPTFPEKVYYLNVSESVPIGTLVFTIIATDADTEENSQITYSIQWGDSTGFNPFTIEPESGKIFTNLDIDRETDDEYKFTVVAVDSGKPPLSSSAEVIITVEDINDNSPIILTKELHTRENQAALASVGTLKAVDLDYGKNAAHVFSKVETSESSSMAPFLVKPNGKILSVVTLDREARSEYSMIVEVRDKGTPRQSSTSTVTIVVDDVNDNKPFIISPCLGDDDMDKDGSYFFNETTSGVIVIDWYCPEGEKVVHQIEATDDDYGDNSKLTYAINSVVSGNTSYSENDDILFRVNRKSGKIFLRRYVRPTESLVQILNISVTDMGNPSNTVYCALNITIDVDVSQLTTPANPEGSYRNLNVNSTATSLPYILKGHSLTAHLGLTLLWLLTCIFTTFL